MKNLKPLSIIKHILGCGSIRKHQTHNSKETGLSTKAMGMLREKGLHDHITRKTKGKINMTHVMGMIRI